MDEPDGVAGVAAVSEDRNSVNKQVLEFESIGNFYFMLILFYVVAPTDYFIFSVTLFSN